MVSGLLLQPHGFEGFVVLEEVLDKDEPTFAAVWTTEMLCSPPRRCGCPRTMNRQRMRTSIPEVHNLLDVGIRSTA